MGVYLIYKIAIEGINKDRSFKFFNILTFRRLIHTGI